MKFAQTHSRNEAKLFTILAVIICLLSILLAWWFAIAGLAFAARVLVLARTSKFVQKQLLATISAAIVLTEVFVLVNALT